MSKAQYILLAGLVIFYAGLLTILLARACGWLRGSGRPTPAAGKLVVARALRAARHNKAWTRAIRQPRFD